MRKFNKFIFLLCGLFLTLAAFPVFAQENQATEIKPNNKPFQDFVANLRQKLADNKLDFTESFSVELEGNLTKDGKLDPKTSKFAKSSGNAEMIEIGKSFIEVINDSGFLRYLQQSGFEKINFTLSQDENQVAAIIKSEFVAENRARTIVSGLNMLTKVAGMQAKSEDEKLLFSYFKASANGKTVSLDFLAPRDTIHELVKKHLNVTANKSSSK